MSYGGYLFQKQARLSDFTAFLGVPVAGASCQCLHFIPWYLWQSDIAYCLCDYFGDWSCWDSPSA